MVNFSLWIRLLKSNITFFLYEYSDLYYKVMPAFINEVISTISGPSVLGFGSSVHIFHMTFCSVDDKI